jgi:hypothetical protein
VQTVLDSLAVVCCLCYSHVTCETFFSLFPSSRREEKGSFDDIAIDFDTDLKTYCTSVLVVTDSVQQCSAVLTIVGARIH